MISYSLKIAKALAREGGEPVHRLKRVDGHHTITRNYVYREAAYGSKAVFHRMICDQITGALNLGYTVSYFVDHSMLADAGE